MTPNDRDTLLERARAAYRRYDWPAAHRDFQLAAGQGELDRYDLLTFADAAWWLGLVEEAIAACDAVYDRALAAGDPASAAMAALINAYTLSLRNESALASGWMSRAFRLVADLPDCVERGYLAYMEFEFALGDGDFDTAREKIADVREHAARYHDEALRAVGIQAEGRLLIGRGETRRGLELLDEAMLTSLDGSFDPSWAGNIYCNVLVICHDLHDIRRAVAWTVAVDRWWSRQAAAGPFLAICRAHRVQVLTRQGAWRDAEREATAISDATPRFALYAVAEAAYQLGEVRRLRGDLTGALAAYTDAHANGRDPQPGLALLRLAEGKIDVALTSIRTALTAETRGPLARFPLRAAQVEIALAAGDLELAREASRELDETAATFQGDGLVATATQARGAILLAEGDAAGALPLLRAACRQWQDLGAPYEMAQARCLLAIADGLLGDRDAAEREQAAARAIFDMLGAPAHRPLLSEDARADGLTEREIEVLRLVAAGLTNRAIADRLFISQKTVARHIANIFTKLDLSSRTAAAAYAIDQGLASARRG